MPYDHEKVETNATSLLQWFLEIDFLLTCVTKFSSVSIWTNTGEAIYPILTGTAVVASNTDTIIDVWKQTTHKTLAQLKNLDWLSEKHSLLMKWKRGIIWTGNNLEGDQLAFNNEKKAADLTIVLIDCFRISIIQSLYHPLFSPRSIWKQQYWSLSALQNGVTEQPIESMRGLGDIVVDNSSIFWLARKWQFN